MWVLAGASPWVKNMLALGQLLARVENVPLWWGTPARRVHQGTGQRSVGLWVLGLVPGLLRIV